MPMRSEVAWKYSIGLEVILVEMDYIIVMEGKLVTGKTHLKLLGHNRLPQYKVIRLSVWSRLKL